MGTQQWFSDDEGIICRNGLPLRDNKDNIITFKIEDAARIALCVDAHGDLVAALRSAADMLAAVAGDIEDGYSIDSLRHKYLMAVVNARDAARAALAKAEG